MKKSLAQTRPKKKYYAAFLAILAVSSIIGANYFTNKGTSIFPFAKETEIAKKDIIFKVKKDTNQVVSTNYQNPYNVLVESTVSAQAPSSYSLNYNNEIVRPIEEFDEIIINEIFKKNEMAPLEIKETGYKFIRFQIELSEVNIASLNKATLNFNNKPIHTTQLSLPSVSVQESIDYTYLYKNPTYSLQDSFNIAIIPAQFPQDRTIEPRYMSEAEQVKTLMTNNQLFGQNLDRINIIRVNDITNQIGSNCKFIEIKHPTIPEITTNQASCDDEAGLLEKLNQLYIDAAIALVYVPPDKLSSIHGGGTLLCSKVSAIPDTLPEFSVHELGHAIGCLWDEYLYALPKMQDQNSINCKLDCGQFEEKYRPSTCYSGCTNTNRYRSTNESVMGAGELKDVFFVYSNFNPIGFGAMQAAIDRGSIATNPKIRHPSLYSKLTFPSLFTWNRSYKNVTGYRINVENQSKQIVATRYESGNPNSLQIKLSDFRKDIKRGEPLSLYIWEHENVSGKTIVNKYGPFPYTSDQDYSTNKPSPKIGANLQLPKPGNLKFPAKFVWSSYSSDAQVTLLILQGQGSGPIIYNSAATIPRGRISATIFESNLLKKPKVGDTLTVTLITSFADKTTYKNSFFYTYTK